MSFLIAFLSFPELKNDTSNQSEINETTINEHNQIFVVHEQIENPRRRTLI
jgi:hypothetical protein